VMPLKVMALKVKVFMETAVRVTAVIVIALKDAAL